MDEVHHDAPPAEAPADVLSEPEEVAVRLSRWLAVLTTVPAGALAVLQALRDGTMTGWLVAMAAVIGVATVLLVSLGRAPIRAQAAIGCLALTLIGWLALLHYGPILGVGTIIAAACVCTTLVFGRHGMIVAIGATLAFLAIASWLDLGGIVVVGQGTAGGPRTVLVWGRTWLTVAGSSIFLCGVVHALHRGYRSLLARALESERRIEAQRRALARALETETAARRAAEDATRVRDEFLSLASHELRTPLTSLKLLVQVLAARSAGPDPALENMERQVRRLERLIQSLLEATRADEGRLVVQRESVDLTRLARDAIAALETDRQRSGSPVVLHAPRPVIGRWDRALLDQVVGQLVGNAIKFGAGQPIDVVVEGDDDDARVLVRDRGAGIPPEVRERLFERFHRGVSWTHYGGLGLGLYLARAIAIAHGGELALETGPGAGSTFTLSLPRRPPARPSADRGAETGRTGHHAGVVVWSGGSPRA